MSFFSLSFVRADSKGFAKVLMGANPYITKRTTHSLPQEITSKSCLHNGNFLLATLIFPTHPHHIIPVLTSIHFSQHFLTFKITSL